MERDQDEIIDGVDPVRIWSRISAALSEDAPHLANALTASVEHHIAAQPAERSSAPQSRQKPASAGTRPEKRLRDVLSEVELIAGRSVSAGTFQAATSLTPVPQPEPAAPPPATHISAITDTKSDIEVTDARLQYYLQKYGMGVEMERVPESQPQMHHAETTVKTSGDVEQLKLARYLSKHGRV
jgi:hypothetical protein